MKFAQKIKYTKVTCPICQMKREIYREENKGFYCQKCKRVVKEK